MTDNQATPSNSAESTSDSQETSVESTSDSQETSVESTSNSQAASPASNPSEEPRKPPKLKDLNIQVSPETTRYLIDNMQLD